MVKDARYFMVGVFVIAGLMGLIGFSIWVVGADKQEATDRYTVYFTDAVSGLKEGASVQYRGVDVGKVLDVRLSKEREDLIKVDIEVVERTPIRRNTKASLAIVGITGFVYMELSTETTDTEPPVTVPGEEYPVLQGSGTQLAKVLQQVPEILKEVKDMAEKMNRFLSDDHIASLGRTLRNVENMSKDLNGLLSEDNVEQAGVTLENFSAISGDVKAMVERFDQTADEIEDTVAALNELVKGNQDNINRFTKDGLAEITQTAKEAQEMVQAIREITEHLRRNPSRILYKQQPQGVEIPQ